MILTVNGWTPKDRYIGSVVQCYDNDDVQITHNGVKVWIHLPSYQDVYTLVCPD